MGIYRMYVLKEPFRYDIAHMLKFVISYDFNFQRVLLFLWRSGVSIETNIVQLLTYYHTGQCKRTGGCYNELVVAFYSTGGGVKGKKIYTC